MGNVKKSPFSDKKSRFVKQCFDAAFTAAKAFNLNPSVIMAQAAIETGWGESSHATQSNNYFGIIACGKINAYWHGGKSAKTHRGLCFRRYDSVENSFMDYGRLLRSQYGRAASLSFYPESFAQEISYSAYICEQNGDNREHYRRMLISIERDIREILYRDGLLPGEQRA